MPDPFTFPQNARLITERFDPADREQPPRYGRRRHIGYFGYTNRYANPHPGTRVVVGRRPAPPNPRQAAEIDTLNEWAGKIICLGGRGPDDQDELIDDRVPPGERLSCRILPVPPRLYYPLREWWWTNVHWWPAIPSAAVVRWTLDDLERAFAGQAPQRDEVLRTSLARGLVPGTAEVPMELFLKRLRKILPPGTKGLGRRTVEIRLKVLKDEIKD